MPVVRPPFVGMHDKPASHGFAPTEIRQFAPLGAASAEFSEDDAKKSGPNQQGKAEAFAHNIASHARQPNLANPEPFDAPCVKRQSLLSLCASAGAIMKQKCIAIRRKHEGNIERVRVFQALLNPIANVEVPVTIEYSAYSLAKGQKLGNSLSILGDLSAQSLHR
jgi:hypothetical protein